MKIETNKNSVFRHLDYKAFLREEITRHKDVRGFQSKLAAAAKCQKSYLSQVLRSKYHITNEQAFHLCEFFGFGHLESDYFLELVNLSRTSLPAFRERILFKLKSMRESEDDLAKRFDDHSLSEEIQKVYYSSWHWSAVHIAVGIDHLQTVDSISERLSLSKSQTVETLKGLESMGLVEAYRKGWRIKPTLLHLPKSSPFIGAHHGNWRSRAVLDSQRPNNNGMHYSVVMSHSRAEFEVIKQLFLDSVDEMRKIVEPSRSEELTCFCLDYFKVN
ncbi:MAG: DUF4423 domain-containing protein [Proteobacteria bacterium]|nr:DUF4423 domain-containing protein [Pseudomonadota bacterium]